MNVIAKSNGFYNGIKRKGDKFTLISRLKKGTKDQHNADIQKQFSEVWMSKVELQQKVKAKQKT